MILRVLACVLLPLAVVVYRMHVDASAALEEAAQLEADRPRQVLSLGRAARRFLPSGPSAVARQRLAELGRAGVPSAYETLRASILAARWLVTPSPALLAEANEALARDTDALEYLRPTPQPSVVFSLLAIFGLAIFVIGVVRATRARLSRLPFVASAGFGLVCMFIGLWRA